MSRIGFLLVMFIAIATTTGAAFMLYRNELGRLRDAVSRGSLVANLDIGPIEYADSGVGIPLLSIHGAGGGFDQGLALAADLVGEGFGSSRRRASAISVHPFRETPLQPRRATRTRRCSLN